MKFKVAGVQHYKADLIDLLDVNDEYLLNKSEILESYDDGDRIYEYDVYDGPAKLVPEPDNEYDSNAIAVMVKGIKIGHVPADLCSEVLALIDDDHTYDVAIMGGPYKEVVSDDIGDMQIEKGTLNFTASLTISKKKIVEMDEPVPVHVEAEQKPSGASRVLNYIMMIISIILVFMGLLLLLVMPIAGLVGIVVGILGFMHFKKRNK